VYVSAFLNSLQAAWFVKLDVYILKLRYVDFTAFNRSVS